MKKILVILLLTLVYVGASAQKTGANLFSAAWDVSFPTNNDFLTKTSLAGFRFDYKKFLTDNLSVGATLSWNSYEQYIARQTYEKDRTAVTTDMERTIYNVPMALTAHYYFKGPKTIRPFAGLGIGAQYSDQTIYYNIYQTDVDNWGFLLKPEIGAYYPLGTRGAAIVLGGSYAWATNKNDAFRINSLTNFSVHLGFAWAGGW
ncbi:outer membrane beta-barrel protein [Flavihumibacter petaseus]|uniref:Uncharacterized protein n=1 Tax=Flavihumibacter petaseus NBRC 106054 TaxID=1220578 RepID=A0A0E9MUL4_9BACT|nr:OmpW family outer membrane protein [Flavihumibacter petaseus]GAO41111.1 hypothetical protein FPE01S_01_01230 [Flavihumibacter petaseus NBRC 106054]